MANARYLSDAPLTDCQSGRAAPKPPAVPLSRPLMELVSSKEFDRFMAIRVRELIRRFQQQGEPVDPSTKEKEAVAASNRTGQRTDPKEVHVVEVVRTGEKIIIPETMSLRDALSSLKHQMDYEEQETAISAEMEGFLIEGAWAFFKALEHRFGWVRNVPTPGFFGDTPPTMISVQVSRTETVQVPWGRIVLPAVEGYLETGMIRKGGRFYFQIGGVVKRKHERMVTEIVEDTRRRIREDSIYKGTAFRIRFRDDDGAELKIPQPEFVNLDHAPDPNEIIFRHAVARQIYTNIYTIITRTDEVVASGVPRKRCTLLSGRYGTGKTLVAAATAKLCEANGWTFIECERADELAQVLRVAQYYGRCCVFCEDIDQVLSGERNVDMNTILNVIDGVDAKSTEVMVVLTTNHVDKITQAMIRPGRIDEVIDMLPPDAEAAERLVRMYGRGLVPAEEDLTQVGAMLDGQIASMVRDVVEVAKLYAISLAEPGSDWRITAEALSDAITSKQMQMALLEAKLPDTRSPHEKAAVTQAAGMEQLGSLIAGALRGGRDAEWDTADEVDGRRPQPARALNAAGSPR